MSPDCTDPAFRDMLHAYELGLLNDAERERFELHLMDCPSCFSSVSRFRHASDLINRDSDVHQLMRTIDDEVETESHSATAGPKGERRRPRSRYLPITIAAAAVLLFLVLQPWRIEFSPHQEAIAAPDRLAIMPFANLSDATDSLATGEVLASLLTADLSGSDYLQVVPQQQIQTLYRYLGFADPEVPTESELPDIARHTSARYILTGDLKDNDSTMVISVAVHDIATHQKIASVEVSGPPGDSIFTLVDRLTVLVKGALDLPNEALNELDPCVADVTTDSPKAYYHYVKAKHAISRMYQAEAARQYQLALENDSSFAMAWYGLWQMRSGDYIDSALAYANNATDLERHFIRQGKAVSIGDFETAAREMHLVLERWPEEPQALLALANFEMQAQQYDSAIHYLTRSIKSDPLFKDAHNQLAYAYLYSGQFDKALETANKYISIAPGEPNPYDTKGDLYAANNMIAEAEQAYSEALRVNPEFNFSAWKLGNLLMFENRFDSAYSVYKHTTQSSIPGVRAVSRQFMAYPLVARGQFGEALRLLDDGISADRLEDQIRPAAFKHLLKAMILAEQSDAQNALAEAEAGNSLILSNDSTYTRTYELQYALLMTRLDSLALARPMAQRLLTNTGIATRDSSLYLLVQGAIASSRGNLTEAQRMLERADAMANLFETKYLLSAVLLETGEPDRSADLLEALLNDHSGRRAMQAVWSTRIHYYLGIAYEATGRNDQAVEQYSAFLDILSGADAVSAEMKDARNRLTRLTSEP